MSTRRSKNTISPLWSVAAAVVIATGWVAAGGSFEFPAPATSPAPGTAEPGTAEPGAAEPGTLGDVTVVGSRPDVAGYDRDCSADGGCVFGPAWSDDVDVDGGHNGCDTRNDILARDLEATTFKPGTHHCVVLTGQLLDPYTGQSVPFQRGQGTSELVQIDHVIPLAAAWDHGANTWTPEQRHDFANDPRNLRATQGSVNASKGDSTPETWMPDHGACEYATAYVDVAAAYALTVSDGDAEVLAQALAGC